MDFQHLDKKKNNYIIRVQISLLSFLQDGKNPCLKKRFLSGFSHGKCTYPAEDRFNPFVEILLTSLIRFIHHIVDLVDKSGFIHRTCF